MNLEVDEIFKHSVSIHLRGVQCKWKFTIFGGIANHFVDYRTGNIANHDRQMILEKMTSEKMHGLVFRRRNIK